MRQRRHHPRLPTRPNGDWSPFDPFDLTTDVEGDRLDNTFQRPDMPVGPYRMEVQCQRRPFTGSTGTDTLVYTPQTYTVTGPSQKLALSSATVQPGGTFQISGVQPCPSDTVKVQVVGIGPIIDTPVDGAGNWSATVTVPSTASPQYAEMSATCHSTLAGDVRLASTDTGWCG